MKKFGKSLKGVTISIANIATETEDTAKLFSKEHEEMFQQGVCFRFNAPGVGDISLDKAEDRNLIADRTDRYLDTSATWKDIETCSKSLSMAVWRNRQRTYPGAQGSEHYPSFRDHDSSTSDDVSGPRLLTFDSSRMVQSFDRVDEGSLAQHQEMLARHLSSPRDTP